MRHAQLTIFSLLMFGAALGSAQPKGCAVELLPWEREDAAQFLAADSNQGDFPDSAAEAQDRGSSLMIMCHASTLSCPSGTAYYQGQNSQCPSVRGYIICDSARTDCPPCPAPACTNGQIRYRPTAECCCGEEGNPGSAIYIDVCLNGVWYPDSVSCTGAGCPPGVICPS